MGIFSNFVLFGWWWFYFDFLGFLNFFFFLGGGGRCAFFVFGAIKQQLNNCFWKIRMALKRAGFGVTCAG